MHDGVGVARGVPEGAQRGEGERARGAGAAAAEEGLLARRPRRGSCDRRRFRRRRRRRRRVRPHRRGGASSARRERAGAQEHFEGKKKKVSFGVGEGKGVRRLASIALLPLQLKRWPLSCDLWQRFLSRGSCEYARSALQSTRGTAEWERRGEEACSFDLTSAARDRRMEPRGRAQHHRPLANSRARPLMDNRLALGC